MSRMLVQTQLSNYDTEGRFILEADSGWQMVMGRVRVMLRLDPTLTVDVMCPESRQLITQPESLNADVVNASGGRLRFVRHTVIPNALATRYDFDLELISESLGLQCHRVDPHRRYTHVYINDPMHLRNFKALFHLRAGYQPKFVVHSHFIDNPECPKFPADASLWMGQVEAARRADYNFWQCESAMNIFFDSMSKEYRQDVVDAVRARSAPWDDGYSSDEINAPVDMKNVRFDEREFMRLIDGKTVLFVPNRVGGEGRSSDYTNCGKFLFGACNELYAARKDFVVIAGNPSQKFSNDEIAQRCAPYVKVVPDAPTRDEYRFIASKSHIAVGLYDQDSYGGTAARELVDMRCYPLWLDKYEYSAMAKAVSYPFLARADFSDLTKIAGDLIDFVRKVGNDGTYSRVIEPLRKHVRRRCSYEETTLPAMRAVGLLS